EFGARRREQQLKWMWAMVEQRMFARLQSDAAIKSKLPKIEAAVKAGELSPSLAAEQIAAALGLRDKGWHAAHISRHPRPAGSGPFPGAPINPSGALAQRLVQLRRPAFSDVRRIGHVFATSYAAVDRDWANLIKRHRPDAVLMFGLAGRTRHLRIEMRARNA